MFPPFTDLVFPPSAQRLATFLQRKHGVWVASPSMALFSALVAGKGRPKRLLLQGDEPSFISNICRIAGAMPLKAPLADLDQVLDGVLKTEGLNPDHVWGILTHRDGGVAPSEWLARLSARGIPTIERCAGSLFALARHEVSLATFTIVELDAEESLAGTHVTALLTNDLAMAERVHELCLPDPDATDYVFDAAPRGLVQDEPALAQLLERVLSQGGQKTPAPSGTPLFGLSWTRRFHSTGDEASSTESHPESHPESHDDAPVPTGQNPWLARLAATEARHKDAMRIASESASLFQSRLDQLQSAEEQWQRRSEAAELLLKTQTEELDEAQSLLRTQREGSLAELETLRAAMAERQDELAGSKAEIAEHVRKEAELSAAFEKSRADLLAQKAEAETELSSSLAESTALAKALARAERERDVARAEAASREESVRAVDQGRRILNAKLDRSVSDAAEREARQAQEWEASRAEMSARIVRLEADAVVFGKARADLVAQKGETEDALRVVRAEKEDLAKSLAEVKADLLETLAEASKHDAAQRALLDEQCQRSDKLQADVAGLTAEADHSSLTISRLEGEVLTAQQAVEAAINQKSQVETALESIETESEALVDRLSEVEKERDGARADAAKLEWSHRNVIADHSRRAESQEQQLAHLKEREAQQIADWTASFAEQSAKLALLEARSVAAERAGARSLSAVADTERLLVLARSETSAAAAALAEERQAHQSALSDVERLLQVQQTAIEEQRKRSERLEADAVTLAEVKAAEAREWEVSRAELSERILALVANLATVEGSAKDLGTEKTRTERALAAMQSQSETLVSKLTEAEKSRELAVAQAAARKEGHELEVAGHKQRVERLEAEAKEAEEAREELLEQKTGALSEAAEVRAEKESLGEQLAQAQKDHDLAVREAAQRVQILQAELSELKQLVELSEKNTVVLNVREARRAIEWERARVEMSAQIASLETSGAAAQREHGRLVQEMAESEKALEASRTETEALLKKLAEAEQRSAQSLKDATQREEAQRAEIAEARQRAELSEKQSTALAERESLQAQTWGALRAELSERITHFETSAIAADKLHAGLLAQKSELQGILDAELKEKASLAQKLEEAEGHHEAVRAEGERRDASLRAELESQKSRAADLEREVVARSERETVLNREWEAGITESAERISRLEVAAVAAENAQTDLERGLATARSEREAVVHKLVEVKRERDLAKTEAAKQDESYRVELDKQRQRAAKAEREAAAHEERAAAQAQEWEASRAELVERIDRLESDATTAEVAHKKLVAEKAQAERTAALNRVESEGLLKKLAEAERERSLALAEGVSLEAALLAASEEQKKRAARLEQESADRVESERLQAREWETERTAFSDRIARLEGVAAAAAAAAAAASSSSAHLEGEKSSVERDLTSMREETEALRLKLVEVERQRDVALSAAERRLDAQLDIHEEQKERLERLNAQVEESASREKALSRDLATLRNELIERKTQEDLAAVAAEEERKALLGQSEQSERSLAAVRSEREALVKRLVEIKGTRDLALLDAAKRDSAQKAAMEEQRARAEQLEHDHAALLERDAKDRQAGEALQAELSARVARLEANELIAEKARTEVLTRKRETERALAIAQVEKEALAAKLLQAERARDRAQADASVRGANRATTLRPDETLGSAGRPSPKEDDTFPERQTGPLSQLIAGLSTGARRRPARKKLVVEPDGPGDPSALAPEFADLEALSGEPVPAPSDSQKIRTITPPATDPPASHKAEENEAIARPAGWFQGLASRIRRGPKGPA